MKKEFLIGSILGIIFGFIGLLMASWIMGFSVHARFGAIQFVVIAIFLLFSLFFGGRAARKIAKGKDPIWQGIQSSVFTTLCTIIILAVYSSIVSIQSATDSLGRFLIIFILTFMIGCFSMAFIGSLFGAVTQFTLKKLNHD